MGSRADGRGSPEHPRKDDLVFTERPPEPKSGRAELDRLVRRLQALTFELRELRRGAEPQPELHAKERELEQLRWRFAAVARRTANDDLGDAA
jgi:hypothetical protein